ncbi:hypothetical protein LNJ03_11635 [Tenacibaculum dicentrarchi]|nr:hypothetical protein [Tenacibaculum dicentrarchi]
MDLEKLDSIVNELEQNSESLKGFTQVYSEISSLQSNISRNLKLIEENNKNLNSVSDVIKKETRENSYQLKLINSTVAQKIEIVNTNNKAFQKSFDTSFNEKIDTYNSIIQNKIKETDSFIKNHIENIYKDNKAFQRELDATLITRLDKHKSDIQVDIRNEGIQIQRAFETTLNSNFNSMESKIKERFELQSKELKTLKILIFVLIGIGIGLGIGLYLK